MRYNSSLIHFRCLWQQLWKHLTALLVLPEHAMMCVPIMTVTAEIAYFLIIFPLRINTSWADLHYCGLN